MTYTCPDMRINGLIMGERTINYNGTLIVKDFTNKIEATVMFAHKDVGNIESIKNSITKIFSSKEEVPSDNFIIHIMKLNPETKLKELVSDGSGSWVSHIIFENKL